MVDARELQEEVHAQWERFQAGEAVDESKVKPMVLRSWERCRRLGVSPEQVQRRVLPDAAREARLAANAGLIEVAGQIMERIYQPVRSARSIISLSDPEGVVLHARWDQSASYPIPDIGPGSLVGEHVSGTNAVSICLRERVPMETLAAEHYCRPYHAWFCAAAPIFGQKNELLGVINVTLPRESYHQHTLGMIEAAAYAVGEQLRLRLLLEEQKSTLSLLDEGVIVLDAEGVVKVMNPRARAMLNLDADPLGTPLAELLKAGDIVRAILAESAHFRDQEAFLPQRGGNLSCMLSVTRIGDGQGRVITMRESRRLKEAAARMTGAKAVFTFDHIVGQAPATQQAVRMARTAAKSDVTTLILGESGTGKELFAQSIHNAGRRATAPFVVVNCGALPRDLVQSELFGYDEGSFTGASRLGKPGKFELADNGTLFLDEIGEMPLEAQASLLRLLQNGEVTRVGGKTTRQVNVRVLAATNRDLQESVRQRAFREDLFYRLNVFTINVPPLRQRTSDIPLLVQHFLDSVALSLGRPAPRLGDGVMDVLMRCPWPGNIRELENIIERMVHMADGTEAITLDLVPASILAGAGPAPQQSAMRKTESLLSQQEQETLLRVIRSCNGNLRAAARELGISRSGLYVKLRRYGIELEACR